MLKALTDVRDTVVIWNPVVAVNQGDQHIGQETRDIEGHQGEDQVVFLLGDEQLLAGATMPRVGADVVLTCAVGLAVEQRLVLVVLVVHDNTKLRGRICKVAGSISLVNFRTQ